MEKRQAKVMKEECKLLAAGHITNGGRMKRICI